MFHSPFSFEGRIRRTEYGLSFIIFVAARLITTLIAVGIGVGDGGDIGAAVVISYIFLIPLLWFLWAQGAKRCHDVGNNGWWQLIPFYGFYLLFADGDLEENEYGHNPKYPPNEEEDL